MAAAAVAASPPMLAGGTCNFHLSSTVHRLVVPPTIAAGDHRLRRPRYGRPSLRLHRELHIHRFLPDGSPWTYEIVDLPDCVRVDATRLFSPPRNARTVFADMVMAMETYGGLPDEAVEYVIGTALSYVRDVAAWALLPGTGEPPSTHISEAVHVHVRVVDTSLQEETMRDYGGGHLTSTAVRVTETRDTDGAQLVGGAAERTTECGEREEEEEDRECCAICLEGIVAEGDGRPRLWLPCSHAFHGDCVGRWLLQKAECPLCRFQVAAAAAAAQQ